MKIRSVERDDRKREFRVVTRAGAHYAFPYAKAEPRPGPDDRVVEVGVDPEIAREGFTYVLESGAEGTVHVEQVLDYNAEPTYLRDLLLHRLSVEAGARVEAAGLSRRELARRLGTSPAQLYRLLDPTNTRKSMNQLVALLQVLDCDVDVIVRDRG